MVPEHLRVVQDSNPEAEKKQEKLQTQFFRVLCLYYRGDERPRAKRLLDVIEKRLQKTGSLQVVR